MESCEIRRLEERDVEQITAAFQAVGWENKPRSRYERYLAEQEDGRRTVLVASFDGAFAGYLTVVWRPDYAPFRSDGIPEIQDLNVLPGLRRRGIGTRLMDAAERVVAERSAVVGIGVGMAADYGAAQRLYVLRGYVPDGRGLVRDGCSVAPGDSVPVDDGLVLYFTKALPEATRGVTDMKDPDEQKLAGGNSTLVVRVGETVRRAAGPWSAAVHGLLRHLEERGFDGAPRFPGFDDRGREILTFVPGEVGNYPLPPRAWSDETLVSAARLLRRYHDATAGFVPPDGAAWQLEAPPGPREVICHNDFAPYNLVFDDGEPRAIIDFDTAGPGPRIWDLAYAAYRFVPLCHEDQVRTLSLDGPPDLTLRLRLFCDAYGLDRHARRRIPETLEQRLEALCAFMVDSAAAGDPGMSRVVSEGHLDLYRRDIQLVRDLRRHLLAGL